jgi:4a-hydroxytetrahydrobiopterin dehydratase
MPKLNLQQIGRRMKSVPAWARRSRTIVRTFEFAGFKDAVDFVNRVAKVAEKNDHHPDIDIRWNKVTLALTTHSEGGLTGKDFSVARECGAIFAKHFQPR